MFASICAIFNKGKMYGGSDPVKNILEASRTHGLGIDIVKNFEPQYQERVLATIEAVEEEFLPAESRGSKSKPKLIRSPDKEEKQEEKGKGHTERRDEQAKGDIRNRPEDAKKWVSVNAPWKPQSYGPCRTGHGKGGKLSGKDSVQTHANGKGKDMKRARKRTKAISQEKAI